MFVSFSISEEVADICDESKLVSKVAAIKNEIDNKEQHNATHNNFNIFIAFIAFNDKNSLSILFTFETVANAYLFVERLTRIDQNTITLAY